MVTKQPPRKQKSRSKQSMKIGNDQLLAAKKTSSPIFLALPAVALAFIAPSLFREEVAATLRMQALPVVYQGIWIGAGIAVWIGVRTLLTMTSRDFLLGRSGVAVEPWGSVFFERALATTAATTLWALLLTIVCFGVREAARTAELLDILGRAAVLGLLLGLLIQAPMWIRRYWSAFGEVGRHCGTRQRLQMHSMVAVCDVVLLLGIFA